MKYVKVLDKDLRPPFQGGRPYEIGVWHHCENFDTSEKECAPGFYVIPVSELIHYHKPWLGTKVLPAEVKGNIKIFSASKRRYEYMKLGSPLSDDEVKALCREIEPELRYKLSEALYPVNPLLLPKATVNDEDIELLKQWYRVRKNAVNSVRDSVVNSFWCRVRYSVWYSVRDSVGDSFWCRVRYSVWYSVRDSVGDSIWKSIIDSVGHNVRDNFADSVIDSVSAYVGSLFPSINKWKYKNYEQGQYPFQSAVNLWHRGLVPAFDGEIWRLHSGKKAEVVWQEPEIGWIKAQEEEQDEKIQ
jgi:hypothetical protein